LRPRRAVKSVDSIPFGCGSAAPLRVSVFILRAGGRQSAETPRRQALRRTSFILKTSRSRPIDASPPQKNLQKTSNYILPKVLARDWKSVRAMLPSRAWKTHLLHARATSFFFLTTSIARPSLPPGSVRGHPLRRLLLARCSSATASKLLAHSAFSTPRPSLPRRSAAPGRVIPRIRT
jgi:hypothetical protein